VKTYMVVFAPEAAEQLAQLYRYIADHGSPEVSLGYVSAIIEYCEGLKTAPIEARAAMMSVLACVSRITRLQGARSDSLFR
jgi:hypothetical protein